MGSLQHIKPNRNITIIKENRIREATTTTTAAPSEHQETNNPLTNFVDGVLNGFASILGIPLQTIRYFVSGFLILLILPIIFKTIDNLLVIF